MNERKKQREKEKERVIIFNPLILFFSKKISTTFRKILANIINVYLGVFNVVITIVKITSSYIVWLDEKTNQNAMTNIASIKR